MNEETLARKVLAELFDSLNIYDGDIALVAKVLAPVLTAADSLATHYRHLLRDVDNDAYEEAVKVLAIYEEAVKVMK